jgi:hypothetical protein
MTGPDTLHLTMVRGGHGILRMLQAFPLVPTWADV